jgi:hypothetical protein
MNLDKMEPIASKIGTNLRTHVFHIHMCSSFCDERLSTCQHCDSVLMLTWHTSVSNNVSLGLWCAGVELGDGGRRCGEGQVGRAMPTDLGQ